MGINLPDRVWLRDDGNDSVELTGPTDGTQYVKLSSILPRVTQDEWDKLDALAMEVERLAERDKEVRRKLGMEDSEEGVEVTNMCGCVECVGDQPEPESGRDPVTGEFAIYYLTDRLTKLYNSEKEAWEEFDEKYQPRNDYGPS